MNLMFTEYLLILFFFLISLIISLIIFLISYLLVSQKNDQEKVSAYECGFNPFENARTTFDIRFYLVAMLFLMFDLEMSFLFPWAISLSDISWFGFWTMMIFLTILTMGFIYEWFKGALEWE